MRLVEIEFPGQGRYSREWLEQHPEQAQELMAACGDMYPRCHCRNPSLPLYIAQRSQFYLARMPNSGGRHAAHCPSYEPEPSQCGRGVYSRAAIEDQSDGRLSVRLDIPFLIRGSAGSPGPVPLPEITSPKAQRDRLGLRGLLHLLWERAGFNRWSPRMQGRRHYRQIHKYLNRAADEILVRRVPIGHHLYVPEVFVQAAAMEIEARRQKIFKERMRASSGAPQRLLLLAQLRGAVEVDDAWALRFSHLPNDFQVRCSRESLARMQRSAEFAMIGWPNPHSLFHVIVLLTLQRNRQGHWIADEITHMVTTEEYLPVVSIEEARLARRLVQEGRQFYKPMCYDGVPARFPAFLLTDLGESAVPLEIIFGQEADQTERRIRVVGYQEEGTAYWCWDTIESEEVPNLPKVRANIRTSEAAEPVAGSANAGVN